MLLAAAAGHTKYGGRGPGVVVPSSVIVNVPPLSDHAVGAEAAGGLARDGAGGFGLGDPAGGVRGEALPEPQGLVGSRGHDSLAVRRHGEVQHPRRVSCVCGREGRGASGKGVLLLEVRKAARKTETCAGGERATAAAAESLVRNFQARTARIVDRSAPLRK